MEAAEFLALNFSLCESLLPNGSLARNGGDRPLKMPKGSVDETRSNSFAISEQIRDLGCDPRQNRHDELDAIEARNATIGQQAG